MLSCRKQSRRFERGAGEVLAALLALSVFAGPAANANANDAYRPPDSGYGAGDDYAPEPAARGDGVYQPSPGGGYRPDETYRPRGGDSFGGSGADVPPATGYGEPYAPPAAYDGDGGLPDPKGPRDSGVYEQSEIISTGHQFFGSISQGLAKGVEWVFQSQGRPNGYILGEDAGGALVLGLRYGEGRLHTKNAGTHKIFWQGPSVGYDAGAEGSKAMILVYNLSDPSQIFERFGGIQGVAYLVGGVSVQLQKHGDVTLAVIRSGVGLRLGANVGYMKYTRSPTWNPL